MNGWVGNHCKKKCQRARFFFLTGLSKRANEGLERQLHGQQLVALAKDSGLVPPEPTWWLTTMCNSSSQGPATLF